MTSPSTVLLRTQSDERLVALARAGHERAFEAIVERYRKPLLRACRRILPEARAEDALQHTLVAAWRGLERGDEVRELRPWLYRIARNTSLNQLRMSGYDLDELMETLTAADDPEEEVLRRAVVRQTLTAVAALPERQREALLRTAINGQGQEEVARDLGLSSTAMRQLVHRARVSVRAAATAVVPMPMATWLASGAGGAGTAATLAKAGTLVVLAGGAVSAPALVEHGPPTPRHRSEAHAAAKPKPRDEAAAVPTATATAAAQLTAATTPARVGAACRPRAPRRRARTAAGAARARTVPTSRPTAAPAAAPAEAATTAAVLPMAERTTAVLAAAAVRATTAATTTKAISSRSRLPSRRRRPTRPKRIAATAAETTAGLGLATQAGRTRARAPRAATTDLASQRRVQRVNTCSTAPDVLEAPCSVGTSHWL